MKVLFVKPPAAYSDGVPISVQNYGPPLGLLCMQTYLRNRGCHADVRIMETFDEVAGYGNYDLIGISAITATRDASYHVARLFKERFPDKTTILGGPHCNDFQSEILRAILKLLRNVNDYLIESRGHVRLRRLRAPTPVYVGSRRSLRRHPR